MLLLGLFGFFGGHAVQAQYAMIRDQSPVVLDTTGLSFLNPWAGGLNNAQFSTIDLNADALPDLMVFEKAGNRWLPFLGQMDGAALHFRYAPEWVAGMPPASVLGLLFDYDGDGDPDILTYTGTALSAWQNQWQETGEWAFTPYRDGLALRTERSGVEQDLRMTGGDVPGLADLDGDGDWDILMVDASGASVELHANQSFERFGHRDSLVFELASDCWGRFRENPSNDGILLDSCLSGAPHERPSAPARPPVHVGSTLCLADLDNDGVLDLLLGDNGGTRLGALYNGGDNTNAFMALHEPNWPSGDVPVAAPLFPAAFALDANGDGRTDLAVSPQDRGFSGNFQNLLLYLDTASSGIPAYVLAENAFLQRDMLDFGEGSCPAVLDADGDGDLDLVVGNAGYSGPSGERRTRLALLENLGGDPVVFRVADLDYANLSTLPGDWTFACPTFADLDGDGDFDMLLGDDEGQLRHFENTAAAGSPAFFIYGDNFYQGIDVGSFAMPALADLDADGLVDLVIGERNGNLNYYRNSGSALTPAFSLVSDFWGQVNVSGASLLSIGFSAPGFYPRPDGGHDMFVGSLKGRVIAYRNVDAFTPEPFLPWDTAFTGQADGERSTPALADFNGDGLPDLVQGNFAGGLMHFRGVGAAVGLETGPDQGFGPGLGAGPGPAITNIMVWPNPSSGCFRLGWNGVAGASQGAPQGVVQNAPQGVVQNAPQGAVQNAPQGVVQNAPQGVVQNAPLTLSDLNGRVLQTWQGSSIWGLEKDDDQRAEPGFLQAIPRPLASTLLCPDLPPGLYALRVAGHSAVLLTIQP